MAWERKGEHMPVKVFAYRHEAELAEAMLAAQGIPAQIFGDDCGGGLGIGLSFGGGIAVYVHERQAGLAFALLEGETQPVATCADDEGARRAVDRLRGEGFFAEVVEDEQGRVGVALRFVGMERHLQELEAARARALLEEWGR
jgi:hypothetical protein